MITQPVVSVLIPSRLRFDALQRTVDSCLDNASSSAAVQIVIRMDSDDTDTIQKVVQQAWPVTLIVGPRRRGYFSLSEFTNECAALATGRWLFPFNDDAQIQSSNWDARLSDYGEAWRMPRCALFPVLWSGDDGHEHWDFPIISRRAYQAVGSYSPVTPYDWFWHVLCSRIPGLRLPNPSLACYHQYLHDGNTNGTAGEATKEWHTDSAQQLLAEAQDRLMTAMIESAV